MAALEAQLAEQHDRLTFGRRLLADNEKQIEQKRAELEEAVAEDARERYEEAMREHEAATASLAEAAELLLDRLAAFEESQDAARAAWASAEAAGAAGRAPDMQQPPPELTVDAELRLEPWERLCDEIRNRIDAQFEDELVDAASRSPLGSAINDLPVHLREVARQRRHAMIRRGQEAGAENRSG